MKKLILKCTIFVIIFGFILKYITTVFTPKDYEYMPKNLLSYEGADNLASRWETFYSLDSNCLDVVFIGSSRVHTCINPLVVYKEYGFYGYDLTSDQQDILTSLYYVREMFKTQAPQVVVVDISYSNEKQEKEAAHWAYDYMKISPNKIEAVLKRANTDDYLGLIFPIYEYHNRWVDLSKRDISHGLNPKKTKLMGYVGLVDKCPLEHVDISNSSNYILSREEETTIDKLYEICKQNGSKLVFINTPSPDSNDIYPLYRAVREYIHKMKYDIPTINYNEKNLNLNYETDFRDNMHMNLSGAEKFSVEIGSMLEEYISLRKENDYLDKIYSESYEYYEELKREIIDE